MDWQGTEHVCLQRLAAALEAEKLLKAGYTKQLVLLKNSLQASVALYLSHALLMQHHSNGTAPEHLDLHLLSCRVCF